MRPNRRPVRLDRDRARLVAVELVKQIPAATAGRSAEALHDSAVAWYDSDIFDVTGERQKFTAQIVTLNAPGHGIVIGGEMETYRYKSGPHHTVRVFINCRHGGDLLARTASNKPNGKESSWIESIVPVLLHEMTHIATKQFMPPPVVMSEPGSHSKSERIVSKGSAAYDEAERYYNSPNELASNIREIADYTSLMFRTLVRRQHDNPDEFHMWPDEADKFRYSLSTSARWTMIEPFLTERNKRRVIQSVYGHLQDEGLV